MPTTFTWDPSKALINLRKHGVAFAEAASVFMDPLSIAISDPDHSFDEERLILLGMSDQHRLLAVVHTDHQDRIRLISAREASRRERKQYEQG